MEDRETILKLYKECVLENIIPTKEYLESARKFSEEIENFSKSLNKEKNEELNKIYECMTKMMEEECIQVFAEGYSWGAKLTTEALCNLRNK